ncbi:hypothetical protein [Chryseobacterium sp. Hurlbut01]|nr:hypothetical protein [Chryseobacterium sp. Hurlbut01]
MQKVKNENPMFRKKTAFTARIETASFFVAGGTKWRPPQKRYSG